MTQVIKRRYTFSPQTWEKKWQAEWQKRGYYIVDRYSKKPKYYVLDMFPYPSGAGLHVGHPLGYIASDIYARFKRHEGYEVLHPMGFDAFGLPAEQYAIQTGTHPAITTERNIQRYKEQLQMLGLSYDPTAEIRTCDPRYYKWTQWIFLKMFHSWYNKEKDKAEPISTLIDHFNQYGTKNLNAATNFNEEFTAEEWKQFDEKRRQEILMHFRLAYLAEVEVNWCPALGTVLANEEVKDGVSERGGYPVYRIPMRQWLLRITAYADRLLEGLNRIDWSDAIKEMQRNWIGKSEGAIIFFPVENLNTQIEVYTTRPDTLYGVTFLVLAPEHPLVSTLTSPEQKKAVQNYLNYIKRRTERERIAQEKGITGVFLGVYALHPMAQNRIPIYISEYVLMHYGTGAVMGVPAHDQRDFRFASHFHLPIVQVIQPPTPHDFQKGAYEEKEGILINSGPYSGMKVTEAIPKIIEDLKQRKLGYPQTTYKLRDAVFSRQRYWGEPIPIVYKEGIPYPLPEEELPLELPQVESYKPTGTGESPLANVKEWVELPDGSRRETHTMPGWAGSSWYFLRYIDPQNDQIFCDPELEKRWMPVDLYVGGAEHAVGHLLYARFYTKFLYDLGYVSHDEPFQKLINQGMILGRSNIIYKRKDENIFVSTDLIQNKEEFIPIHVAINLAPNDRLNIEEFKQWMPEYKDAQFILNEKGEFICDVLIEKMSKSFHNVVNPDDLCERYGADTFRLYEMFLGPITQHKPWDTNGITGVYNFLKRLWEFCVDEEKGIKVTDDFPTQKELHELHKTIQKVRQDIETLSFNTCVSQFMIFLNFLTKESSPKRALIEPFLILLSPFAPHIAEELWHLLGHTTTIQFEPYPKHDPQYLIETTITYPVAVNGKVRAQLTISTELDQETVQQQALQLPNIQKHIQNRTIQKIIFVPKKMINIVVK